MGLFKTRVVRSTMDPREQLVRHDSGLGSFGGRGYLKVRDPETGRWVKVHPRSR